MEKRLKLLESGGAVVKPGGQGQKNGKQKLREKVITRQMISQIKSSAYEL